jgi:hypothetical protein
VVVVPGPVGAAGVVAVVAVVVVVVVGRVGVAGVVVGVEVGVVGVVAVVVVVGGAAAAQLVCAGLLLPIPLFVSHSYPAFASDPFGSCPCGFLLSAFPTQPAHGSPVALPLPFPFALGDPLRVEQYGPPGHWPFAPPPF